MNVVNDIYMLWIYVASDEDCLTNSLPNEWGEKHIHDMIYMKLDMDKYAASFLLIKCGEWHIF